MAQMILNSYTKDYHDYCFLTWYGGGRPKFAELVLLIEKFQDRMRPSAQTLSTWHKDQGWEERADAIDQRVMEQIQEKIVTEKALMLSRHADIGRRVTNIGLEYLENNPITSQGAALRAIQLGVEIESEAAQVEKLYKAVSGMEDAKVVGRLRQILDRTRFKTEEEMGGKEE